ncbi:MAG TPA: hypothetical protein VGJ29_13870 [Vicinamibacterales bacterium]|jgi:hypothetical protein
MAETHYPGTATHGGDATNPTTHHETSDINIRGVFAFGIALFVAAVLIHFMIWLLFMYFNGRESVARMPQYPLAVGQHRVPPEPRLQTNPREDLRDLRASEDAILNGYGWVDRNNGVVHIPIDEAMKLTLQRGLPVRQGQRR